MEQVKTNTKIAGVDVGKRHLDAAADGLEDEVRVDNGAAGLSVLVGWLKAREVGRVGLEASGGYERGAVEALRAAGFEVVLHQPLEVRLFARLRRLRAKNDRLDARLIAAATARVDTVRALSDPRLQDLAERLTAYEQACDQAAELKGFLEHVRLKDILRLLKAKIRSWEQLKAQLAADIQRRIKAHPDLARRLALVTSLPGVGPIVGMSLVIRMPELGQMKRGQAAALLGVAPYDRDSGQFKGQRFIGGGRRRPRRMLYMAALAAKRSSPGFKAFAASLAARAKPPKLVLVAIMRKLIEAANLVLSRAQPWTKHQPA
jgi:transposase